MWNCKKIIPFYNNFKTICLIKNWMQRRTNYFLTETLHRNYIAIHRSNTTFQTSSLFNRVCWYYLQSNFSKANTITNSIKQNENIATKGFQRPLIVSTSTVIRDCLMNLAFPRTGMCRRQNNVQFYDLSKIRPRNTEEHTCLKSCGLLAKFSTGTLEQLLQKLARRTLS